MDYRTELLTLAEAYATARGCSVSRVANLAKRDGNFFARLRAGRTCGVDTLEWLLGWFAREWPEDLPWPSGIARPAALSDDEIMARVSGPRTRPAPTEARAA